MWHSNVKSKCCWKIMLIDRLAWCRVATNLRFVKKTQYLWSAIKQSAIKWVMPVYKFGQFPKPINYWQKHGFCIMVAAQGCLVRSACLHGCKCGGERGELWRFPVLYGNGPVCKSTHKRYSQKINQEPVPGSSLKRTYAWSRQGELPFWEAVVLITYPHGRMKQPSPPSWHLPPVEYSSPVV